MCGDSVELVGRGGFFGGPKEDIPQMNNIYYSILNETLSQGYMGTEESIFSIMLYKNPTLINYYEIDGNGLINKFFEDDNSEKKEQKFKIVLEYTEEDYNKIIDAFKNYSGSREQIIFKLLEA